MAPRRPGAAEQGGGSAGPAGAGPGRRRPPALGRFSHEPARLLRSSGAFQPRNGLLGVCRDGEGRGIAGNWEESKREPCTSVAARTVAAAGGAEEGVSRRGFERKNSAPLSVLFRGSVTSPGLDHASSLTGGEGRSWEAGELERT